MKRSILALLLFLIVIVKCYAAFVEKVPITLIQPNGEIIHCFASGDEFFNWAHDADGYPIIKNPKTGYYVYAVKCDNKMQATNYIVGSVAPQLVGLSKEVYFPKEKIIAERKLLEVKSKCSSSENTGVINNIVVFIRFNDETEFPRAISQYNSDFNDVCSDSNSMYQYFKQASYNQLFINSSFYPAPSGNSVVSYQDNNPRSYYMPYDELTNPNGYEEWERTDREQTLLANAMLSVQSQISPELNIDFNNDDYVDNVCFIVRGEPTAWATLLWPHRWALFNSTILINGKQVWDFNFQIESFFELPSRGVGVLNHEMFHTLGAPDLYHYDWDYRNFRSVGNWDLMDRSTNPSESMCAWMKYNYGQWIENIPVLSQEGIYTINSIDYPTNNSFAILRTNSNDEFFVLEYRSKRGVFESSIPGSGLVFSRINPNANGNANYPYEPDEVYIYRPYGTDTINGKLDSAFFCLASGRVRFNNNTNPASILTDGTLGNFYISILSETDTSITFYYGLSETSEVKNIFKNHQNNDFICYPNPSSGFVNIKANDNSLKIRNLKIYNTIGKTIFNENFNSNEILLDFINKPKGIYFIEFFIENKRYSEKISVY